MKIDVVETGSGGNCFLFDDEIMIDCGIPYSHLEKVDMSKVKYILLSHEHEDHYQSSTVLNIAIKHKNIKFVCNSWMAQCLEIAIPTFKERIDVIETNVAYQKGDFTIASFNLYHDVPNVGYRIVRGGYKHIHATDTVTMSGIHAKNYDSATLECNHCIDEANRIIFKTGRAGEYSHLKRTIATHLSVQNAIEWCKLNGIKKLIPVHVGGSTSDKVMEIVNDYKGA